VADNAHTKLGISYREVLTPTHTYLVNEDEGNHHTLPIGSNQAQQGSEQHCYYDGGRKCPLPIAYPTPEGDQQYAAKDQTNVWW